MSALMPLLRTKTTVVWSGLILATLLSWMLGHDQGAGFLGSRTTASVLVLLIAFAKVRFVGLYFMELRNAPFILRGIFEGYCLVVCALVIGMYLAT